MKRYFALFFIRFLLADMPTKVFQLAFAFLYIRRDAKNVVENVVSVLFIWYNVERCEVSIGRCKYAWSINDAIGDCFISDDCYRVITIK